MKRATLLYTLSIVCSLTVRAQRSCPWLTEGTAATALGGPVRVSVQVQSDWHGSCSFLRGEGATSSMLEISVGLSRSDACGLASQNVSGVGNEAVACHSSPSPHELIDVISSRVRAAYFTVSLTLQGSNQLANSEARRQEVLHDVAEQVAGALY
jgi:hypothetical protein